ncbi:MAG: hypothetical protein HND52_14975 [Ignavibacteriae bacterium]|nr:hypothetical protein [Ignavibacteriota bacterium]NOG99257.1 hypothetical protein [Ignavibacteriota bacterium]
MNRRNKILLNFYAILFIFTLFYKLIVAPSIVNSKTSAFLLFKEKIDELFELNHKQIMFFITDSLNIRADQLDNYSNYENLFNRAINLNVLIWNDNKDNFVDYSKLKKIVIYIENILSKIDSNSYNVNICLMINNDKILKYYANLGYFDYVQKE